MEKLIEKARVLVEALPWIRRFRDKLVVIKYGGAAMVDDELKSSFARDVTLLRYIGLRPLIVHGGGPQIAKMLERLGVHSEFVDGLRVTNAETMGVVEMVLGGTVNAEIVSLVGRAGGHAVGLDGRDGDLLRVRRVRGNDGRDLGFVGAPEAIDPQLLLTLTRDGTIPVIAPLGCDASGQVHNINADVAAGALAAALGAEKLVLLTDVEGVLDAEGRLCARMTASEAHAAISAGSIAGGMIPKVECCASALAGGVTSTHIVDGRLMHALLLEIFTDTGVGTQIVGDA